MINKELELILIDLDGTLLNSDLIISEQTKQVIHDLLEQQYKIAIATGRHYKEAKKLTKEFSGLAYITTNGSYVEKQTGDMIFSQPLAKQSINLLLDILNKYNNVITTLFTINNVLVEDETKFLQRLFHDLRASSANFKSKTKAEIIQSDKWVMPLKEVADLKEFTNENEIDGHKCFVIGEEKEIVASYQEIRKKLKSDVEISNSGANNLEINAANISKGKALKELAKELGISLDKTIAFGDSGNDLEMLKVANIAVAMGNSKSEKIREEADFITESNDNQGVAKVLSDLL